MSKFSPNEIVSSIFKRFKGEWLSPEFIRDESNLLCDALSSEHVGDPGRAAREFQISGIVEKDAEKATAYRYNPSVQKENFGYLRNLYENENFNKELYELLQYLEMLKKRLIENHEIQNVAKLLGIKSKMNSIVVTTKFSPAQTIYYGVPGCGKSKRINDEIDEKLSGYSDKEFHKVRCVFHPEYGNADFVGQIYPCVPADGGVDYRFKPGPFAEIVRRAYRHPSEPFFLIIEEINRGNAAAIFGEMFQLLDRIRPGDPSGELSGNVYSEGWSAYGVDNADVNAYIRMNSNADADSRTYDEKVLYGERVGLSANTAIRLPPNLSIFATMNTSDQNVFALDNAFLRRFRLKMIRNDLKDAPSQYELQIGDTGIRWGNFWKWINDKILLRENGISRAEDKCLGGWFIIGKPGENFPKDEFAEKVLKYLWDDVFKRGAADAVFRTKKIKSLSKLIEAFEYANGFGAFEEVFDLSEEDKRSLRGDESVSNDDV